MDGGLGGTLIRSVPRPPSVCVTVWPLWLSVILQYTVRCRPARALSATVMGKVSSFVSCVISSLVVVVPCGMPTNSTVAVPGRRALQRQQWR